MQHKVYNPAYDKAFSEYLRSGREIDKPYYLKDKVPEIYVWRARGDEKVRVSHQANDGKIFTCDNPPPTGHPGQDYNCRCKAEPYVPGVTEYVYQTIVGDIGDNPNKWGNSNFVWYAYKGLGRPLNLSETGHLKGVINYFFFELGIMKKINAQIIEEARKFNKFTKFTYHFKNNYSFKEYLYCFGGSVVSGLFSGTAMPQGKMVYIRGNIRYKYSDLFTDPARFRDKGTPIIANFIKIIGIQKILLLFGLDVDKFPNSSDPKLVSEITRQITDLGITPFEVYGDWDTEFRAGVLNKKDFSFYK